MVHSHQEAPAPLLQCNWLSIKQLIFLHTALQIWRVQTTKSPVYIDTELHLSKTRSAAQGTMRVPLADKSVASKSFMVRSAVVWNEIPADIRNCKTLGVFKKKLKQWIRVNVEIS